MKIKNLVIMAIFAIAILAFSGIASAMNTLPVTITGVEIDDVDVMSGDVPGLEKANEVEVVVEFEANADLDDVQVEAQLRGYDHNDLMQDITSAFDVHNGTTYKKTLKIDLKERMDQDRKYSIRVMISNRYDDVIFERSLDVATTEHSIVVQDVTLDPAANGVKAGRGLSATVRLQNRGTSDEDDVKVTFSIPDLNIVNSDYIDTIEADGSDDDSKSTEAIYLRIPDCAKPGVYEAVVKVTYDGGDEVVTKKMDINVLAGDACELTQTPAASAEDKTIISVGPESQDVVQSAGGVVYPMTITNAGGASKTYVIEVTGGDWGTFRVSPSNVVTVGKDEAKTVYIYVSALANAPVGQQVFGVAIKSGDKTVKEVTLKANVVAGKSDSSSLKEALKIGVIVLVIILVILGLIIGFRKLKEDDNEKEEEGKDYY